MKKDMIRAVVIPAIAFCVGCASDPRPDPDPIGDAPGPTNGLREFVKMQEPSWLKEIKGMTPAQLKKGPGLFLDNREGFNSFVTQSRKVGELFGKRLGKLDATASQRHDYLSELDPIFKDCPFANGFRAVYTSTVHRDAR